MAEPRSSLQTIDSFYFMSSINKMANLLFRKPSPKAPIFDETNLVCVVDEQEDFVVISSKNHSDGMEKADVLANQKMNQKSNVLQRSVQCAEFVPHTAYQRQSKMLMKDTFVRSDDTSHFLCEGYRTCDWYCDLCKYKNFARNEVCRQCNKRKTPKKHGDWDCAQCGVLNFASRNKCFKCNASIATK
eukprot:448130_1